MSKRESVWLAGIDTPARMSLDGDRSASVVVVGGGVAGMTTALLLQQDGFEVVLLEAERIGHGSTGNSTGKISSLHGLLYRNLIERHGRERAGRYGEANQQAIDVVESIVENMAHECHFARVPAYVYTTSVDTEDVDEPSLMQRRAWACRRTSPPKLTSHSMLSWHSVSTIKRESTLAPT